MREASEIRQPPPEPIVQRGRQQLVAAERRFGVPEWVALLLYAGLVAWLTAHHEPWADEAQAWLLARDNSFFGMLRQMHYEGSPALWHMLLWVEIRLGLSYAGMHWVSSAIGVASAFLLLRYSPFPRWARLLLPFSAFMLFHGPIIARSYGLSMLLMLGLAAMYRANRRNTVTACVVCGLLANTSLFGFIAALGFAVLFLGRAVRVQRRVPVAGLLVICALLLIALQQALPAPDAEFNLAGMLNRMPALRQLFSTCTGIPVNMDAFRIQERRDAAVREEFKRTQVVAAPARSTLQNAKMNSELVTRTKQLSHAAIFFVSSSVALAALFYAGLVCWLVMHRKLHLALPFGLLLVLGNLLNYTEHHVLMLWGCMVATLWMAWPRPGKSIRWIDPAFCLLLLAILVEQAGWSVNVARQDVYGHFDPGKQLAVFLQNNAEGRRIDSVTYYEVSSQPYLQANPFHNIPKTYWPWAIGQEPADDLTGVVRDQPDMIVASTNVFGNAVLGNVIHTHIALQQPFYADKIVTRLKARGFVETHRFCGRQPMHFGYAEENCLVVLEPGHPVGQWDTASK